MATTFPDAVSRWATPYVARHIICHPGSAIAGEFRPKYRNHKFKLNYDDIDEELHFHANKNFPCTAQI